MTQTFTRFQARFMLFAGLLALAPFTAPAAERAGATGTAQVHAALERMQVALAGPAAIRLDAVRRGEQAVARRFARRMPSALFGSLPVPERKRLFIATVLPLVLAANEEVLRERRRLLDLLARPEEARSPRERQWLDALGEKYGSDEPDVLRRRVDIVPPSLALSQAVEESGWGRSRFSRLGNAVFGQRVWRKGAGIVPKRRAAGQTFEVQAFDSLLDSVRAYLLNLNTHDAYRALRRDRATFRARGETPRGEVLAASLLRYSERGEAYVKTLRAIMRGNRFQYFDSARLAASGGRGRS